jgi:tryptophanyl-tRNA synthetase
MLKAIYGEHPIGIYMAAQTQVGDIYCLKSARPHPVVVPVGFDKALFSFDSVIAAKHGLVPPSSTYISSSAQSWCERKMSKREPLGHDNA